jgi:hypothetical protein
MSGCVSLLAKDSPLKCDQYVNGKHGIFLLVSDGI